MRPKAAGGTTLAIDSVHQNVRVGKRSSLTTLRFNYRSTQGGRHVIKLPADARVTAVRFDSAPVQLRPEKGELPLSLTPGSHTVEVDWEQSGDVGFRTHPGGVDLRSPASNIGYVVAMPESRWPLFAVGPGVGPAVLYWGELVVFIGVAWLLGRWSKSPLRFTEWLLLGLGLSTQSWFVFSLTAAWLLIMRWREQRTAGSSAAIYNAVQVGWPSSRSLTIAVLVFSGIRNGLLSAPDMGVEGAGSGSGNFAWFARPDRGSARGADPLVRADVGLSRAVLRVGELDGVRAGALAALGVQRVEVGRTVAPGRVKGRGFGEVGCQSPLPSTGTSYSQRPSR